MFMNIWYTVKYFTHTNIDIVMQDANKNGDRNPKDERIKEITN